MKYHEMLAEMTDNVELIGGKSWLNIRQFELARDKVLICALGKWGIDDDLDNATRCNILFWLDTFAEYDDLDDDGADLAAMSHDTIMAILDVCDGGYPNDCPELSRYQNMWRG